jgi:hypothetical protein
MAAGCGGSAEDSTSSAEDKAEPRARTAVAVPAPPVDGADPSSDELISDTDVASRFEKPLYEQNQKLATGSIRGRCILRADQPWPIGGKGERVDLSTMTDAMEGESDYYRKYIPPRKPVWAARAGRDGPVGVVDAFVVLEDVTEGPRQPLDKGAQFNTLNGVLTWCDENSVNGHVMKFATVNSRLRFAVFDPFPYDFVVTDVADGRKVWELSMAGHESGWHRRAGGLVLPYHALGHARAVQAPRRSSPALGELGHVYRITAKRHPWIEGYVILVSNPYVTRTSRHKPGHFIFGDVPVGRRTLRVWHPTFKAAAEVHEVEVRKDEITEIAIDFEPRSE